VNRLLQHARIDVVDVIQPAPVESRVSGIIGGVKVAGYVDQLDSEGRLIDSETTIKPIRGIAHDHRLQLTSYAMITSGASGACRLDMVTKGKTVALIQKSFCVSEKDRQFAEMAYPMVQDSIRDGIFLPRRNNSLCSRRYCGYRNVCEKEYDGSVYRMTARERCRNKSLEFNSVRVVRRVARIPKFVRETMELFV
jgi:hypothetical protein